VIEVVKRQRTGVSDIQLLVIDNSNLIHTESPSGTDSKTFSRSVFFPVERTKDDIALDWANDPLELLVFACIPSEVILSRISAEVLVENLLPYFFRK
jgi:hypothetical protein